MKNNLLWLLPISLILLMTACQKRVTSSEWVLNTQKSSIAIVSTKNSKVTEVFEFEVFSGKIHNNKLEISIDLNSLETNIPIRNERIEKHLFETGMYPTADIHTQLNPEDLTSGVHTITFDVDLHGVSGLLEAEFLVTEQNGNKIVTLHKPLIVDANKFGLENGIITLKNIAKLNSINFTVPINIVLTFKQI